MQEEFDLKPSTLIAFCTEAFKRYRRIPYHNMYHGFNVLQVGTSATPIEYSMFIS